MADQNQSRLAREMESREADKRPQAWVPPETLPSPNPRPGYVYRWIRASVMGQADPTNVSAQFRTGWEPVKAVDHPELQLIGTTNSGRFKDNIEIGGLILCKAPEEVIQARAKYYKEQNDGQIKSVDNNFMRERSAQTNMELFAERKSATSFGRGTK
jgi:hypothetical protein